MKDTPHGTLAAITTELCNAHTEELSFTVSEDDQAPLTIVRHVLTRQHLFSLHIAGDTLHLSPLCHHISGYRRHYHLAAPGSLEQLQHDTKSYVDVFLTLFQ